MAGSSEQELAIRIAGKVENSLKKSLGMTEDGINHLAGMAKKAAVMITGAFAAIKVGQFIGDAVSEYSEFEQSMANTSGIAGATASEYEKLSKAAREAGKATTFTASEAADALGYMALAGWDVETSTKALTPVLKLAEATQADLATTSDQVTDSMSAMGVGIDELQEYLDVVVMTNNKANTTSADLMDAMIGCGGAARASGMDFKETATALGILANNGVKGAEAGTALNSMLVRISTKDAAKAAFKELGVAVYDNAGRMRDMRQILIDLNGAMSGLTEEEKNNYMAAIAGTNYYSKFGYLLDGVKEGVDGTASAWDALSDNLNNSEGALDEMDKKVTNTLKGAMARMGSAVSDLKISMIEAFGPHAIKIMDGFSNTIPKITENFVGMINKLPIDEFMTGIGNMSSGVMDFLVTLTGGEGSIDSFSNMMRDTFGIELPDSIKSAIEVAQDFISKGQEVADFLIGTLKNAIGNVMDKIAENEPTFESILDLLSDLKWKFLEAFDNAKPTITYIAETAIPNLADALLKVVGGVADVADTFVQWDGFLPTITAIGVAVGAVKFYQLVTGIYSATKAMSLLTVAKIKDKAETIYLNALYAKDAVLRAASTVQTYAAAAGQWVWNAAATAGAAVTSALGAAFAFLTSPIGLVILAIAAIIAIGVLLWKNWDTVKEKAGQLGAWIGEKFASMKEAIGNAVEGFKNKFPVAFAFIEGVFNGFKATVDGVIGGVKQIFQGVIDFVKGVFTGNWRMALDGLKNIFSGVFNSLGAIAMAPLNALGGIVTGAFNAIDTATGGKLSEIKAKASEAWNNVKDTAGNVLQAAKDTISEKLGNIKAAYDAHGGGIQGVAAGAMEGIKGYYSAGFTFINNLTGGKLDEIKSAMSTKMSEAQAAVGTVLEGIKSKFQSIMDGAKSIVSGAIESIKGFFNFHWELPKLKMPHFSVTGEFSLGPPPKIPKFGVEWYKDGGIMTEPTLFGMNGNNAMVGGEAGAEAILPLAELWKNMGGFIDRAINNPSGTIGSVIQLLAQRVEDFAVGSQRTPIAALAGGIATSGSAADDDRAGEVTIHYAPVYRFEGEAPSKTDLVAAEKMSQAEFDKMMRQWQKDKGRVKF
ncbi:MAG: phage tail tape measure protein [Lachnospiraceae bacterium oral taxon 082]|nr:phage tail tape measure protein [Lachnospiraceae bacterium oral taxon 082]DAQ86639.1 MAG TPA: minor tail protein [Caudoviricetes sp.]